MTSSRLELVVLQFDADADPDAAQRFVQQTDRSGHVHVVIALTAQHEWDGSVVIEEWNQADDLSDLIADLAAHRQLNIGHEHIAELARSVDRGATLLVVLLEHRWAEQFATDLDALGGAVVSATDVLDAWVDEAARDIGGLP